MIRTDARMRLGATPLIDAPARAAWSTTAWRGLRIVGLALLAITGVASGAIAALLLMLMSGLMQLC